MATATPSAKDKKLTLQQQIEALQKQMEALDQEAIHELKLKLSDARKVVTTLEAELEQLTGRPSGAPKVRRERRPAIADDALKDQLLKVLANFGKEGYERQTIGRKGSPRPVACAEVHRLESEGLEADWLRARDEVLFAVAL